MRERERVKDRARERQREQFGDKHVREKDAIRYHHHRYHPHQERARQFGHQTKRQGKNNCIPTHQQRDRESAPERERECAGCVCFKRTSLTSHRSHLFIPLFNKRLSSLTYLTVVIFHLSNLY